VASDDFTAVSSMLQWYRMVFDNVAVALEVHSGVKYIVVASSGIIWSLTM